MSGNDIARVYASSLIEAAQKKNLLSQVEDELNLIADLYAGEEDFRNLMINPGISRSEKIGLIQRVFGGNFSDVTVHFSQLLVEHDRQSLMMEIRTAFSVIMDDLNNRLRVTVTASVAFTDEIRSSILGELKKKYKKDIILKEKVDESILGGIIIKIGDLVIDGSLAKDLKNIRTNLITSRVRSEAAYED